MPQFESLKAWVQVDGVKLEEFQVEIDEEKRTVRCHIPSEAGKAFVVHWTWAGAVASRCQLTVDGRKDAMPVASQNPRRTAGLDTMSLPDNQHLVGQLKFGQVLTTDDESASLQDEHVIKSLGSIEMTIWVGRSAPKLIPHPPPANASGPGVAAPLQKPIYERMKKAGSHQVVLGEIKPTSWAPWIFVPNGTEPVRFIFLYRSKDILLAQGIMPRPAAPVVDDNADHIITKEEEEDEPADDKEDERRMRALEEQEAAIKAQKAAIKQRQKRKSDGGERQVLKKLKIEEIDARAVFRPGEVIDLCDD